MANNPMASVVLELLAQEDKAYSFVSDECAARVFRGRGKSDQSTDNQVVWGADTERDVMLLASKGSPDAANLEELLRREGLTVEKQSGSFEYYHISKEAVAAKLKQRTLEPKLEARKDAELTHVFSLWNALKQLYGKVDKEYGFMLNHADEVKNVKDNYYYVRRRRGWLHDRNNSSEGFNASNFTGREAAEILLLDSEIRQHAKDSDRAFYLHTCLSGQVGLLYCPNYGVDKDYYAIKKEDVNKVAKMRDDGSGDFCYDSREALRELISGCYGYRKLWD